jgi:uncharacterized protein (TIGR00369 family)
MAKMRERIDKMLNGEIPQPPIAQLIGFRLTSANPGEAVIEFEAGEAHANPMGTLHGGVLCDIADAAMGMAFGATLAEGESFTTLELKINFLKPIWKAKLKATGKVTKQGKTIGLIECDVTDEQGSLVAHAISTCLILRGGQAEGR